MVPVQTANPNADRWRTMKKWLKRSGYALVAVVLVVSGLAVLLSYNQAGTLVRPFRRSINRSPADHGLEFVSVHLTGSDGVKLAGWYIPSRNRAAIILQHGYQSDRTEMLFPGEMLARHGYGLLMLDQRSRGASDGDVFTFGKYEVRDIEAAYQYLVQQPDVDRQRIGSLGDSMGASVVLLHAAENPGIKAVVADSAMVSMQDEIETGVRFFTGLPPFPFAPLIQWFAERRIGFPVSEIAPIDRIRSISPRPVFLLQGGRDTVIPSDSGQRLYDAAGEPRQLWFDPQLRHCEFWWARPREYEKRVVAFFDHYLVGR
jgi:uncharacterized protein